MSNSRMEEAQAKHISRLNEEVRVLRADNNKLSSTNKQYKAAHDYYMRIQKVVLDNESVMIAWEHFILVMKLSLESDRPGLTSPEDRYDDHSDEIDRTQGLTIIAPPEYPTSPIHYPELLQDAK